ncbi:MAG: AAC(3) family N-acetyltransferase [Candidatus Latescibacteria bacterium]|nr:AAC(3) family N-acetyltransferase [Candidatus Latescibacterota bacterium]
MDAPLTGRDLDAGLRQLGIVPGEVVLVHSSLKSFGRLEGGARTVVQTLLDLLGESGTLVVPTFHHTFFWGGPQQVWDREQTPSYMGLISETARTWPGARRSRHAPHPLAAIGAHAADLAGRHNTSDYAFDSPFYRLLELDAWVLLMGVDFNVCTLLHMVEELAEIPYRHWAELSGIVVVAGQPSFRTFPFLRRYPGVENDFLRCGRELERQGLVQVVRVGQSTLRALRVRRLCDYVLGRVRQDPLFLVSAETRREASRYLPRWGELQEVQVRRPLPVHHSSHPVGEKLAQKLHIPRAPQVGVEPRRRWETRDGLVLEEMRFQGGIHPFVPALLAYPRNRPGPLPAVLCLHGTGENWQWLMEEPLSADGVRLRGWARELARRGYATLALTQYAHPPRPEPWDWSWSHSLPLFGHTSMGRLVSDALLAVDFLCTRPEVDASRLALTGFSLGGIVSFYSMAVDPRIAAGATFCGGVGSVRHLLREGSPTFHSAYFYPHGLLAEGLDHPQLLPALAPRPLLLCAATEDPGMPLAGVQAFAEAARAEYAAQGRTDAFGLFVEEGDHALTLAGLEHTVAFLDRHLKGQAV